MSNENTNIFSNIKFSDTDSNGKQYGNKYQPDIPSVGATEMKKILDELPDFIIAQLNSKLQDMSDAVTDYAGWAGQSAGMQQGTYCKVGISATGTGVTVTVNDEYALAKLFLEFGSTFTSFTLTYDDDESVWKNGDVTIDPSSYGMTVTGDLSGGETIVVALSGNAKTPVDASYHAVIADGLAGVDKSKILYQDDINQINSVTITTVTIPAGSSEGWTTDANGVSSYQIDGLGDYISEGDYPRIFPDYSGVASADMAATANAWENITAAVITDNGQITFYCAFDKPDTAVTVKVETVKGVVDPDEEEEP